MALMPVRGFVAPTEQQFQSQVVGCLLRIQEQLKDQHQQVLVGIESVRASRVWETSSKDVPNPSSDASTPPFELIIPDERAELVDKGEGSTVEHMTDSGENFDTCLSRRTTLSSQGVSFTPTRNEVEAGGMSSMKATPTASQQAESRRSRQSNHSLASDAAFEDFAGVECLPECDSTGTRASSSEGYLQPAGFRTSEIAPTSGNRLARLSRGTNASASRQPMESLQVAASSNESVTEDNLECLAASSWVLSERNQFVLRECFANIIDEDNEARVSGGQRKFEWSITVSMYPEKEDATPMRLGDDMMHSGWLWRFLIVRPNSLSRIAWDILGSILILYDLIALPLQAFPLSNESYKDFQTIMAVVIAAVWSLDILWSMRTGIYVDGLMEMRPVKIMRRYLKTGFPFDVLIVVLDWSFAIALIGKGDDAENSGSFTFGKWMRILRLSRLVRLVKLIRVSRNIYDSLTSEVVLAVLQIMRLVLVIVFLCHYVACAWYALGSVDDGDDNRWVIQHKMADASVAYRYLTSLHWSLTQFTPASMEIYPRNEMERLFNIGALVFGLITFSSFISSLTAAMAHLASVRGHRLREETQLRQFLSERKISVDLGMNIRRYFSDNYEVRKTRVNEIDIEFFMDLPPFLLADLHAEIYMPIFCWHPLFKCYNAFDYESARKICHFASEQRNELQRHNVFLNGTLSTEMLFVNSGELIYHCSLDGTQYRCMSGQWLCEPALWGTWTHRGRLSVQATGDLVSLNGSIFCSIASEELKSFHSLRIYARNFAAYILEEGIIGTVTDLQLNIDVLHDMVSKSFNVTRTSFRWGEVFSGRGSAEQLA